MATNDQYALNWHNHTTHIRKAFDSLLAGNEFVDVTLACEGKKICAHKMLLSACSTYFHDLFRDNPCQHPIVILKDVKYQNLVDVLKFIYNGEVSVATDSFDSFLKTAELLQISGLTDDAGRFSATENDVIETTRSPTKSDLIQDVLPASKTEHVEKSVTNKVEKTREAKRKIIEKRLTNIAIKKRKENVTVKEVLPVKKEEILLDPEQDESLEDPLDIPYPSNETYDEANNSDAYLPGSDQKFEDVQDLLAASGPENYSEVEDDDVEIFEIKYAQLERQNSAGSMQCKMCDKQFTHPRSLIQHLAVHKGRTKCPICYSVLSRKYELKKHLKRRHDVIISSIDQELF